MGFQFMRRRLAVAIFTFLLCSASFSQQTLQKDVATVTFTCDFPGSNPDHYFLSVADDGAASYDSTGKLTKDSDDDPYRFDFVVSEKTRVRIFALAVQAKYFEGQIDSGKKLAVMGKKTLTYKDSRRSTAATYNYSSISAVQDLTRIFQSIAMTLESQRRLEYAFRYQKLALDEELKTVEEENNRGSLGELDILAPVLQKITADSSLVNVARARAQRLLAVMKKPEQAK